MPPLVARIHIFGASGSGTSTLGRGLSERLGIKHLDTDNFYWKKTDPPFTEKVPPAERIQNILTETEGHASWILSGSLVNWGGPLVPYFTHCIFVTLNPDIRIQRLIEREKLRYGARIEPGGDMADAHRDFIDWARSYDTAQAPTRSRHLHEAWIETLPCPVLTIDAKRPLSDMMDKVIQSFG